MSIADIQLPPLAEINAAAKALFAALTAAGYNDGVLCASDDATGAIDGAMIIGEFDWDELYAELRRYVAPRHAKPLFMYLAARGWLPADDAGYARTQGLLAEAQRKAAAPLPWLGKSQRGRVRRAPEAAVEALLLDSEPLII